MKLAWVAAASFAAARAADAREETAPAPQAAVDGDPSAPPGAGLSPMEQRFARVWRDREWGPYETKSGPGSRLEETGEVRRQLERLLVDYRVERLLDAACGDFHWMREVHLGGTRYLGLDVVPNIVADNAAAFADGERIRFRRADLTVDPLPQADVVLCRDVLVHLPNETVERALANIRASGSAYLLATTYTDCEENVDIELGGWRAINLERPPFSLGPPTELLNESDAAVNFNAGGKSLGLWRLAP